MALTNAQCRNATCPDDRNRIRLTDRNGLYLEARKNGGKYWYWKFRFDQKESRLSLGSFPDTSLADARSKADEARRIHRQGDDPRSLLSGRRGAHRASGESFQTVAEEWFENKQKERSNGHRERIQSYLERDVFPYIGKSDLNDLDSPKILSVLRRMESRGVINSAHRVRGWISNIYSYAIATGKAVHNPASELVGALRSKPRPSHFSAITEPSILAALLRDIDTYAGYPVVRAALQLAPHVFVRPGELRKAKWEDVYFDDAQWRFSISKTSSEHIVPLSSSSISILADLYSISGHGCYLFPSLRGASRPISDNTLNVALRNLGWSGEQITSHGFRAIARTMLDEQLRYPIHLIEHQVGHAVRDALGRAYNRTTHIEERTSMMQGWSDYLDSLKELHMATATI